MSETWAPKDLSAIEVMFCTSENFTEITSWLAPLFDVNVVFNTMWGSIMVVLENEMLFLVAPNQYVYLDEDGLHTASKETFEMLYKKVEEPA